MNSEGDQSKVATMSKQLVANGNDLGGWYCNTSCSRFGLVPQKTYRLSWLLLQTQFGANLVKDLKKPGGNITGVSDHNPAQQQVELIKGSYTKM